MVVAPAGIFTIETKADLGKVEAKGDKLFVNGFDREHDLKQAFAEALAVRDYLKGISRSKEEPDGRLHWVTPLLVFTRGNVFAEGKCRGVYVMSLSRLPRFIKYERQRLDAKERSAIAAALGAKVAK